MDDEKGICATSRASLCAFGLVTLLCAGASYAQKFKVLLLDKLPSGTYTNVNDMNDLGQVVGSADEIYNPEAPAQPTDQVTSAVIWNLQFPTILQHGLPEGFVYPIAAVAEGVNDQGIVVGSVSPRFGPVVWGGLTYALDTSFPFAGAANDINAFGQIVGSSYVYSPYGPELATYWASASASYTMLPLLAGYSDFSIAWGINASAQIVGESWNSSGVSRATRWTTIKATDLGTFPNGLSSGARRINDLGWTVGWATTANNREHAALWLKFNHAFDLGTLGGKTSYAMGINSKGDIVGSAKTRWGADHAVLWTHKHFIGVDLNAEISAIDSQHFVLTEAVATNNKCQIAVNGYDKSSGAAESFVLSLTDQSNCN
jgi:probable HAF family extracellular repeat protein